MLSDVHNKNELFTHLSIKHKGFQFEMLQLIRFVEIKLTILNIADYVINTDFEFIFEKNLFYRKLVSFPDIEKALAGL